MTNFYDRWLGYWDEAAEERRVARRSIHPDEFEWVDTEHDHRAALLISRETGFRTWGTTTMLSEIPAGACTGLRKSGEQAVYIVAGTGFSVIDDVRYDWKKGSVLAIPFGAPHRHYNTGEVPARYLTALTVDLERFVGMHRTTQLEGRRDSFGVPQVRVSADGLAPDGTRILLHREQGTVRESQKSATLAELPKFDEQNPLIVGDGDGMNRVIPIESHNAATIDFMRNRLKARSDMNSFSITSAEISGILVNAPHEYGGMHAHMEAHLFILAGSGHSVIDGEKVEWSEGSALQVQGPQTSHRHVNLSDEPSEMLRIAFGIRYYFEGFAKREFPYLYLAMRQGYDQDTPAATGLEAR